MPISNSLQKFYTALKSLHESSKAMTHCLGKLCEETVWGAVPTNVSQDMAYWMVTASRQEIEDEMWRQKTAAKPGFAVALTEPTPAKFVTHEVTDLAQEFPYLEAKVVAALNVYKQAKQIEEYLDDTGLPAWFRQLEQLVDNIEPHSDLLSVKRELAKMMKADIVCALKYPQGPK